MRPLWDLRELSRTEGTGDYHFLCFPCTWIVGRISTQVLWFTSRASIVQTQQKVKQEKEDATVYI